MEFYVKNKPMWSPDHNDVDWRDVAIANLGARAAEVMQQSIWFNSGDGLDQECTQENTRIYQSFAHDDSDCVLVYDPRDESNYSIFRDQLDGYDETVSRLHRLGSAVLIFSMYPQEEIARAWLNRLHQDTIGDDFTIPAEWSDGEQ